MSSGGSKQEEESSVAFPTGAGRDAAQHAVTFCNRYVALRRKDSDHRDVCNWICDQRTGEATKKIRDALKVYCRKHGVAVTKEVLVQALLEWRVPDGDIELVVTLVSVLDSWGTLAFATHVLLCLLELAAVMVVPSGSTARPPVQEIVASFTEFVQPDNDPAEVRTKFMLVAEYATQSGHAMFTRAVEEVETKNAEDVGRLVDAVLPWAPQLTPFKPAWKNFCDLVKPHMEHIRASVTVRAIQRARMN